MSLNQLPETSLELAVLVISHVSHILLSLAVFLVNKLVKTCDCYIKFDLHNFTTVK